MTLKRMDNVLIVVDDLEAVKAFFIALALARSRPLAHRSDFQNSLPSAYARA